MCDQVARTADIVSDNDITVVIQGPLYLDQGEKGTNVIACVDSVRRCLPNAKIIVSTWDHERLYHERLESLVDCIVYAPCPEPIVSYGWQNNIIRQIVSTKNGMVHVETRFVLKLRANFVLKAKTEFFADPGDRINFLALVADPVARFVLFSLPDYVQFGKTEMVRQLWDFDIPKEEYFLDKVPTTIFDVYSFPYAYKFSPEQYLGMAWATNRHGAPPLIQHQFDVNYSDFIFWRDILANDFRFFDHVSSGFVLFPERYIAGKFLDPHGAWLNKPARPQFVLLLLRKYILFVFKTTWWKHFAKFVLFTVSKRAYWLLHSRTRT
jgi:hypothetical protein